MGDVVNLGEVIANWSEPPCPNLEGLDGKYVSLERLTLGHAHVLHEENLQDGEGIIWHYLLGGPYESVGEYQEWMTQVALSDDPYFYAVKRKDTERVCGIASYLRINPKAGSIEIGHINFAPHLQRTKAATEAIYLMMKWAFDAGYRRVEWKCNALNTRSRRAAQRYGFSFEGIHRQALVSKGRNRDTAWFSVLDKEWPALDAKFKKWLNPSNFDAQDCQKVALIDMTQPLTANADPIFE